MKLRSKYIVPLLIGALFSPLFLWSQTPAYFKIGEAALKDIKVYSLFQSSDEQLYISSDQGIFLNSCGEFIPLQTDNVLGKLSLFGLIEYQNNIYCYNLAGQIFIIKDNKLFPFITIPKKYVSNRIQLVVDQYGRLIFFSKGNYLHIKTDKSIEVLASIRDHKKLGLELSILPDNRFLFSSSNKGKYQELDKNKVVEKSYSNIESNFPNHDFHSFFTLNDQLVVVSLNELKFANSSGLYQLNGGYNNRFFSIGKNEVWGLKNTKGITALTSDNKEIKVKNTLFKDQFISCFHKASDGTIYLGTFNRGVIVIPKLTMFNHYETGKNGQIIDFAIGAKNQLLFSEAGKGILTIQDSLKVIEKESIEYYNSLYWIKGADFGINKKYPELYYEDYSAKNGSIPIPTVSKLITAGKNTFLMASSKGILKKGPNPIFEHFNWSIHNNRNNLYSLNGSNGRIKTIGLDTTNETIYFSSLKGTFYFDSNSDWQPILYKGKQIICHEILTHDNLVWFATVNKGLLVYKNQKLVKEISFLNAYKDNQVKQLAIRDSIIYLLNDNHLKLLDLRSNKIKTIGMAEGISGKVTKFEIKDSLVWMLVDNTKILYTAIQHLSKPNHTPSIYIDSITTKEKRINHSYNTFAFDENEFTFHVDHRNTVFGDEIVIKYRIKGFEEEWNEIQGKPQKINYKFMPDGAFTFQVFSQYNGYKSKIKSYSFTIYPPYWQTWWFYTILIFIVGSTIVLIFQYRIKNIKKRQVEDMRKQQLKAEVVEAELRALRSQMNPHFIFNSLQSIQSLILDSELERSYDYLVIFSKMVRNVLQYSNEKFISISSELEFLDHYLKLEELRFEDDFQYSISYSGDDDILVPSLIIQPFIENALIHGLHHKKENKRLAIRLTLNEHLHCEITDNGIGREANKEIQERQGNQHESFAIKAIEKRLKMFTQDSDTEIGFTITDLYQDGESHGTKVDIFLPIIRKY